MDRYEEALERARKYYNELHACRAKEELEVIFPELAESEDKRMWQWIREHINHDGTNMFDKAVAWLEKQKEQKPIVLSDKFEIALEEFLMNARDVSEKTFAEDVKEYADKLREIVVKEQKPAEWTDDEKDKLNRIYWLIGNAADTHAFSTTTRLIGDKEAVELQDFLRSIAKPDSKPAEWSEEDEDNIKTLIQVVRGQLGLSECRQEYIVNWLKSRRPQSKPTEDEYDGKAMLYVAEKQYERGKKDGYREGFDDGYKKANETMSFHYDMFHNFPPCYAPGGVCTNPQMDCINCPKKTTGGSFTVNAKSDEK